MPQTNAQALIKAVTDLLSSARTNRKPLTDKWTACRNAFYRDAQDGESWPWPINGGSSSQTPRGKAKREVRYDIVAQKVKTAASIIRDALFKGNRVAFMLSPDDVGTGLPQGEGPGEANQRNQALWEQEQMIHRQFEDCDAQEELTAAILLCGIYGDAFVKRTQRSVTRRSVEQVAENAWSILQRTEEQPAIVNLSPFSVYWDMEARNWADVEWVMEESYESREALRRRADLPYYDAEAVRRVAQKRSPESEPQPDTESNPQAGAISQRQRTVRVIEFWGKLSAKAVREYMGGQVEVGQPDDAQSIECHVILAGGELIRFAPTKVDDRPYHRISWEQNPDGLGGVGLAEVLLDHQEVLTDLVRSAVNNARKSSDVSTFLKRRLVDNFMEGPLEPGRVYDLTEECRDAREAVQHIITPNISGPLQEMTVAFMQYADLACNIPRAEQGVQAETPQTAFELQQRLERAGKYLGMVISNFDRAIEDIVRGFYYANLLNPDIAEGKGAFKVKALGFSSFENRVIRANRLVTFLQLVLSNPELAVQAKLRWLLEEIAKSSDIEPDQVLKTQDEMAMDAQAKQQELAVLQQQQPAQGGGDEQARKLQAEIDRLMAETELARTKAQATASEATISRARAVVELSAKAQEAQVPTNGGETA